MSRTLFGPRTQRAVVAALVMVLAGCDALPKLPGSTPSSTSASAQPSSSEPVDAGVPGSSSAPSTELYRAPKTANEKKLEASSTRFHEVMLGETMEQLALGSVGAMAVCFQRYQKNKDLRNRCMQNAVLALSLTSAKNGYDLAVRDEQESKKVRALQVVAEDLKRDNDQLQAVVDATTAQVAESKARLAVLNKDIAGKRIAASQAQAARKREEDNLANMRKSLEDAKLAQSTYKATAENKTLTGTAAEKKQIDAQIKAMDTKVVALERNIKSLQDAIVVSAV